MSTYFSVFDCQDCGYREVVGFIGERNDVPIYCSACRERFCLAPPLGETLFQTSLPHEIFVISEDYKKSITKGRKKKMRSLGSPWVSSGIKVPIIEDLKEIAGQIFVTYAPRWESVPCPHCQKLGTLLDFRSYLQRCPECHSSKMLEGDL